MPTGGVDLKNWTHAGISEECRAAYGAYKRTRNDQYTRYFRRHQELKGNHPLRARDLAAALPTGHENLAALIEPGDLHREHLSANSSQILALAVLGSAMRADRSLSWLFAALQPPLPPGVGDPPAAQLEKTLAPETLGEQPRQTAIDFFVESRDLVLCVEAKWTEAGLGACSCEGWRTGGCSERVLGRAAYWSTAKRVFGLPAREASDHCPIQAGYQAVRNAAAAAALAAGRDAAFGLIYDAENPYFKPTGSWPGWPAVLRETIAEYGDGSVRFAAVSWQDLIADLPVDDEVIRWAKEKHGLAS